MATGKRFHTIIKEQLSYFMPILIFELFLSIGLLIVGKIKLFNVLHGVGNNFFDPFFKVVTHLGDGIVALIYCIGVFFKSSKKQGILVSLTFIAAAIVTQFLKHVVFSAANRPALYLPNTVLRAIKDVKPLLYNSFPSGHTVTAVLLCYFIARPFSNSIKIGIALLAILLSYSRIYLGHHFPSDVIAGIGIAFLIIAFYEWLSFKTIKDE